MPTPNQPPAKPTLTATAANAVVRHAFKGLADWVQIFKAGTHTDSKGSTATFTAADLDQMVANVGGAGVPAVLGHPKSDDRAWAWAKPDDVKRDGDALLAKFSDIDPDFAASVDAGAYRERSVSIYKDPESGWTLRHVGWLGAVPPALKLKPLNYAAPAAPEGAEVLEFASSDDLTTAWAIADIAGLLRGLRESVIADKGLDAADKVLPEWRISSVANAAETIRAQALAETDDGQGMAPLAAFAAPDTTTLTTTTGATDMPVEIKTQSELEAVLARARADGQATAQAQFSAMGAELSELRAERQRERIGVQINGWTARGLVTPAEAVGMAEFMAALEGGQAGEFAFSAADKSEAKKTPAAWFADFMAGRQPVVRLGHREDLADPGPQLDVTNANAIATAARDYMATQAAAGRTVSIDVAVQHVTATLGGTC